MEKISWKKNNWKKIKKSTLFMGAGLLLMAAALFLMLYNWWDENRADSGTKEVLAELAPVLEDARKENGGQENGKLPKYKTISGLEMPTVEIQGKWYIGRLEIPSLGLELPVMSQWNYEDLKTAPCRYQGSAYQDNLIIAAHNYTCHFGTLDRLLTGAEIYFTDVDGNRFAYQAVNIEVLQPAEIEEMCSGDWDLTLFTCTYSGRARLTVRCTGVDPPAL